MQSTLLDQRFEHEHHGTTISFTIFSLSQMEFVSIWDFFWRGGGTKNIQEGRFVVTQNFLYFSEQKIACFHFFLKVLIIFLLSFAICH